MGIVIASMAKPRSSASRKGIFGLRLEASCPGIGRGQVGLRRVKTRSSYPTTVCFALPLGLSVFPLSTYAF